MSTTASPFPAFSVEEAETARQLAQMRLENDALMTKLAQLGGAMRGLTGDLATARRESRRMRQQLEALRLENARLLACVPPVLRTAGSGRDDVG